MALARLGESQQEEPAGVPADQIIPFPSVWPDIGRAASLSHFIKLCNLHHLNKLSNLLSLLQQINDAVLGQRFQQFDGGFDHF